MSVIRTDTDEVFDRDGNVISSTPVQRDVTAVVNGATLEARLREVYQQAKVAHAALQAVRSKAAYTVTSVATAQTAVRDMQADVKYEAAVLQEVLKKIVALGRLAVADLDSTEDT